MAAKRGASPLPRRSRMRAGDRARATALMVRLFGLGETIDGTADDAAAIEQVLGIAPNGRRHSIAEARPWLTGPAKDLLGVGGMVGLPGLLDAAATASDAELDAARQTVVALIRLLPLVVRMVSVMSGDGNYAGLAGLGQLDQEPGSVVFLVPLVIAMFRAGWNENLDAVILALRPFPDLAARADRLPDMPAQTVAANLAGQPAAIRQQAQRIIDAAIDGQFQAGHEGRPGGD